MTARGRPRLDPTEGAHSPRVAVRLPDRVRRQLTRRAIEEGRSVSDAVRAAIEAWIGEPSAVEQAETRRLVKLTDREREALFLASNSNLERLVQQPSQ
jgi:Arc/MetJ-type ribon-helix-helix transcriptional regulator